MSPEESVAKAIGLVETKDENPYLSLRSNADTATSQAIVTDNPKHHSEAMKAHDLARKTLLSTIKEKYGDEAYNDAIRYGDHCRKVSLHRRKSVGKDIDPASDMEY